MPIQLNTFESTSALDDALAGFVAAQLSNAIAQRGRASLVVSGGRTPIGFFEQLRDKPIEWVNVTITLADERWVDETSADSNAKLVRAHLLQGAAKRAHFIPLFYPANTPDDSARLASDALAIWPQAFDVVVLGMGDDGHTASLFPNSVQLAAALYDATQNSCIAVEGSKPPPQRLTLTAPRLQNTRHTVLHITGNNKWKVLGEALSPGPVEQLPIRAFLQPKNGSCHAFWTR